ncbi:acyl-CoA dehydrogenase family protein [Pseudomonas sp. BF-R-19]|uniref:acyl-CoA dehydrogenase family protein n=1 Tax=Pseudomonas sp. BF-R-19 TaxID=2832397 RepID=UPI001CBC169C|nr:acyl-CoA dehydrogenase [Pseudomonas sp. BF-R-19]
MDFNLSNEQQMIVDTAKRYVREHYGVEARRNASKSSKGFSAEHWNTFGELGWLLLPISEDNGGLGGSMVDVALLAEELGRGLVSEPFVDAAILASNLLAHALPSQARDGLLERMGSGDALVVLAHMEPGGRCEYDTEVTTSAVLEGDTWRISGTKHFVAYGTAADYWLLSAKITDGNDFALFLVPKGSDGVTVATHRLIDGTLVADLRMTDLNLPTSALLIECAESALIESLDRAVVTATAIALGAMEAVMAMTSEYLKTRVQYGRTLASFQALQHRMAEMFVEINQARAMLYSTLAAFERGDGTERSRAVSGAKVIATRAYNFIAGESIQLHGGIGVTEECAVSHYYKSMLVYDKRLGDQDFHLKRARTRAT